MIEERGQLDLLVLGTTPVSRHVAEAAEQAGLNTKLIVRSCQFSPVQIDQPEETVWSVIPEPAGGFRGDVIGPDGPRYFHAKRVAAEAMPIEVVIPIPDWTPVGVTWRDEIPRLLGAQMHFLPEGDGEAATTDAIGRTSVDGLYCVPRTQSDGSALGVQIAQDLTTQTLWPAIQEHHVQEVAPPAWASRLSDLSADLPVCRYEPQTVGDIKKAADAGARDMNQLKQFTRMGMGICQGRPCEEITATLMAQHLGVRRADVGRWTIRPPLDMVDLATLAGTFQYSDIPIPRPAPL